MNKKGLDRTSLYSCMSISMKIVELFENAESVANH